MNSFCSPRISPPPTLRPLDGCRPLELPGIVWRFQLYTLRACDVHVWTARQYHVWQQFTRADDGAARFNVIAHRHHIHHGIEICTYKWNSSHTDKSASLQLYIAIECCIIFFSWLLYRNISQTRVAATERCVWQKRQWSLGKVVLVQVKSARPHLYAGATPRFVCISCARRG